MKKKKILIYNWVQFDEKDGGGVTVYVDNIINYLKNDNEIFFISSGVEQEFFNRKCYYKQTKNKYGDEVKSFKIINSPVLFANNQFSRIDIYNSDKIISKVFDSFINEYGPFDVIHFNNLEGLSLETLKLKEKNSKTKFIYSMHNYFPICPNVYLWQHDKFNCKNYQDGKKCINCINGNYKSSLLNLKVRTILKKIGIDANKPSIKKLYNKFSKRKNNSYSFIKNEKMDNKISKDYETFRKNNVEYLNKYMDAILCVSKKVKQIAEFYGINDKKCFVSYIGTKFADNIQSPQKTDIDEFNLIYLGYMNKMKGFDFLINSLSKLDVNVSKQVNLTLVCRYNSFYDLDKIILMLRKKFKSVTYVDGYTHQTLPDLLNNKSLGVIPVVWEDNLPQVAIEITSFGVPILCSDLGGASELCDDVNFKFSGGDYKDFNKKLAYFVNNRKKLSNYWKKYNKPTTMKNHIKELYKFYGLEK